MTATCYSIAIAASTLDWSIPKTWANGGDNVPSVGIISFTYTTPFSSSDEDQNLDVRQEQQSYFLGSIHQPSTSRARINRRRKSSNCYIRLNTTVKYEHFKILMMPDLSGKISYYFTL